MANASPEIDLNGAPAVDYAEYDPVTPIAPGATVSDADSADFDQGVLTVAFTSGGTGDDQLRVSGGDFWVEEADLYYQGIPVGSVAGGTDGSTPLTVIFNAAAGAAVAAALIRAIGYVNYSQSPASGERIVTFTLTDGDGGTSAPRTAAINVAGTDTPPVARDDAISAMEDAVATGSLFGDNGNGEDSDPDGILTVAAVNGSAANVGKPLILDSGAKLTVYADGTYSYDPNGRFDDLADSGTGAVNASEVGDVFTYALKGGATATATVTVNGVASPGDRLLGDEDYNDIQGTQAADLFVMDQGGRDIATGLGGDDVFFFGGAMESIGMVDGGDGYDTIVLQGDYSFGLHLRMMFYGVEAISLLAGSNTAFGGSGQELNSYEIQVLDFHFAAGIRAKINGSALLPGENLYFLGSAETDADFLIYGGRGTDLLWGGKGNDIFFFDSGRFAAGDRVDGGPGYDGLFLRGNYSLDLGDVTFGQALVGIENITLTSVTDTRYARSGDGEFDYFLTFADGNVAAGQVLTVSGALLTAQESMSVNGGRETDGMFRFFGGAAGDVMIGGAKADLFHGGLGADESRGGGGADVFRYESTAESANGLPDLIFDFTPGTDRIELDRIDANSLLAGDQAFAWIGSAAFSGSAGELRAHDDGWRWLIEGDVDGDGSADFTIALILEGPAPLGAGDFVL
ncbi:MAG TPA: M10 family metallopeptidase C-terminal domain-containing protein [Allosphingosinicella sp.]|nr:M10 family metallopeptidase C-terminal domain-containing protein [Allosphingosinicella sp.]